MSSDKTKPYVVSPALRAAVEVAIDLQMPLLLTGEPGTGKTQLAYWIAEQLLDAGNRHDVLRFNTKSNSVARDLFYRYDAIRHFRDAQRPGADASNVNPLDYVSFEALGKAILARDGRQRVVLVDEIDKATRDFPNDLLFEFEEMAFRVEEATQRDFDRANEGKFWEEKTELTNLNLEKVELDGGFVRLHAKQPRPILILTSNSEKNLPDAFLRRCVYHHIDFPDKETLRDIIEAHFPEKYDADTRLELAGRFEKIRDKGLRKLPATAELVRWVEVLGKRSIHLPDIAAIEGKQPADRSKAEQEQLDRFLVTYAVLAKNKDDIDKMR